MWYAKSGIKNQLFDSEKGWPGTESGFQMVFCCVFLSLRRTKQNQKGKPFPKEKQEIKETEVNM